MPHHLSATSNRIRVFASLFAASPLLCTHAWAGVAVVKVSDFAGRPLHYANVTFIWDRMGGGTDPGRVLGGVTNNDGFLATELPNGNYTLRVALVGYARLDRRGVSIDHTDTTFLSLCLCRKFLRLKESDSALPIAEVLQDSTLPVVSEEQARRIAETYGLAPGLDPWKFEYGWVKAPKPCFAWTVTSTNHREGRCADGTGSSLMLATVRYSNSMAGARARDVRN